MPHPMITAVVPAKAGIKERPAYRSLRWTPAFAGVRKCPIGPLRGFLGMRNCVNAIKDFPHAEERPTGASRSTHNGGAANFLTPAFARVTSKHYCMSALHRH
jgi:hypothetical protein